MAVIKPKTFRVLQTLIDTFTHEYNPRRPHRSLPRRATPATVYATGIKAAPGTARTDDTHDRVRSDRVDKAGIVTLRIAGQLRHIGVGRTYTGTYIKLLAHDLDVTIIDAATGETIRELTIDPDRDYQPTGRPPGPTPTNKWLEPAKRRFEPFRCLATPHCQPDQEVSKTQGFPGL